MGDGVVVAFVGLAAGAVFAVGELPGWAEVCGGVVVNNNIIIINVVVVVVVVFTRVDTDPAPGCVRVLRGHVSAQLMLATETVRTVIAAGA